MEIVRFARGSQPVTIHITITGLLAWQYVYNADGRRFTRSNNDPGPSEHALGMPSELELDRNDWEIRLGNFSHKDQDYDVLITWKQDGQNIHEWSRKGTLKSDVGAYRLNDSALLAPRIE